MNLKTEIEPATAALHPDDANPRIGSTLDEFLKSDDIKMEVETMAANKIHATELDAIKAKLGRAVAALQSGVKCSVDSSYGPEYTLVRTSVIDAVLTDPDSTAAGETWRQLEVKALYVAVVAEVLREMCVEYSENEHADEFINEVRSRIEAKVDARRGQDSKYVPVNKRPVSKCRCVCHSNKTGHIHLFETCCSAPVEPALDESKAPESVPAAISPADHIAQMTAELAEAHRDNQLLANTLVKVEDERDSARAKLGRAVAVLQEARLDGFVIGRDVDRHNAKIDAILADPDSAAAGEAFREDKEDLKQAHSIVTGLAHNARYEPTQASLKTVLQLITKVAARRGGGR